MDISATSSASSSSSFSFSDIDVCSVTAVKQKKSTYLKRGLSLITRKYKPNIRRISKADVVNRRREFTKWLMSEENVTPDSLGTKHRDALFKKFVKKWNGKKLSKNYYLEADSMWVSPATKVEPVLRENFLSAQNRPPGKTARSGVGDSWHELAVSTPTDSSASFSRISFGTFGKRSGATALRQLQATAILSRPDCSADDAESKTVDTRACENKESPTGVGLFDRRDAKRTGLRHAITVCRTAL